ncbi:hypothetical protein KNP414_00942 [Paenibacillus mucilaginosus KNP414]|uniref:Uncharacterized protein n=1 Tax=Paenibacillus mucilaginosus (strain KNP414) TaxID=1036673 RepID=F8F7P7_PAEMK|nr:hypothetical protein KNP414_00942 [Paenibacillus mucilaginosus KNP414]
MHELYHFYKMKKKTAIFDKILPHLSFFILLHTNLPILS